ncbi:hypothetical protein KP509_26G036100 [Ceratopteris richardii]|uniref:NADH-ubiquinone oxidoreductase chain 6 n=1 Tax=Ceratopteris richardii TaxID=49495 RepID=A0A8T2RL18_CERRI|nr:hypothetical protein KP509_26G036100 [Ceratopteris richardii]
MLLFDVSPGMALVSAVTVIRAKNPVHSVLFFIPVPRNTSGLLPLSGLDFFAMIFLVVHIGAIAVSLSFVVMMPDTKIEEIHENILRYFPVGGIIGLIFRWTNLETLGNLLYTNYSVPFLVSSLISLVAMIGAIVLTIHKSTKVKRQDVF